MCYLPGNWEEKPPVVKMGGEENKNGIQRMLGKLNRNAGNTARACTKIQKIVPDNSRHAYDVHEVLECIADKDSFFEVQKDFAQNAVIGFGRMEGKSVGFICNQPAVMGGSIDYHASDKMARFVRFCDCFNIPLITLVDVPAFLPGTRQEHNGIIRHGAKVLYAYSEATVPKITLIMRKAYGGAYIAMNSKEMGADLVFAWPIAEIAVMGADGAVNIAFKRKIKESYDPRAAREAYKKEYEKRFLNPYVAAARGYVNEVIRPDETRDKLLKALNGLKNKKTLNPQKKHGNIPL